MQYAPLSTSQGLGDLGRLQEQADRAAHRLSGQHRMLQAAASTRPIAPAAAQRLGIVMVLIVAALLVILV